MNSMNSRNTTHENTMQAAIAAAIASSSEDNNGGTDISQLNTPKASILKSRIKNKKKQK